MLLRGVCNSCTSQNVQSPIGCPHALVPSHVFSLTAICKSPSTILSIRGEELRRLFQESPHIGLEVTNSLLRIISSRFRYIEQLLVTGKKSPLFEIHTLSAE